MKLWIVNSTITTLPQLVLSAEDEEDRSYLTGLKTQLDNALVKTEQKSGLLGLNGPTCECKIKQDEIVELRLSLLLGEVEIVGKGEFPPKQENREKPRLVAQRKGRQG